MRLAASILAAGVLQPVRLTPAPIESATPFAVAPSAPTAFAGATAAEQITFSWTPGVGGGAVTSYSIQRSAVGAGSWSEVATAASGDTTKNYAITSGSSAYDYRIVAQNAGGSAASSTIKVWSPIKLFEDTYTGAAGYLDAHTPDLNNISVVYADKAFGIAGASKHKLDGSGQIIGEAAAGRDVTTSYGNGALPDVYTIIDWLRPNDGAVTTACPGLHDNKDAAAADTAVKGFTFYGLTSDNKWYFFHHNGATDTAVYTSAGTWTANQEYKITRRYERAAGTTTVTLLIDDVEVYSGVLGVDHLTNHTHYLRHRNAWHASGAANGTTDASNNPILNKTQIWGGKV